MKAVGTRGCEKGTDDRTTRRICSDVVEQEAHRDPVRHTPVRHTPVRHTPVRHTPVRHTPVRHTPVVVLW